MIKQRDCPICGAQIMLVYIRPDFDFYINEKGEIERDTNNDLWDGKDSYLKFRCGNDEFHDINIDEEGRPKNSMQDWIEDVTKEFYEKAHHDV